MVVDNVFAKFDKVITHVYEQRTLHYYFIKSMTTNLNLQFLSLPNIFKSRLQKPFYWLPVKKVCDADACFHENAASDVL